MLPLWRSLICNKNKTTEYAARDSKKFAFLPSNKSSPASKWVSKLVCRPHKMRILVFQAVHEYRFRNSCIHDATAIRQSNHLIRTQPHGHLFVGQNRCHAINQLRGQLQLMQIIIQFKQCRRQSPVGGMRPIHGFGSKTSLLRHPRFFEHNRWWKLLLCCCCSTILNRHW
jgi:hypothetical protein